MRREAKRKQQARILMGSGDGPGPNYPRSDGNNVAYSLVIYAQNTRERTDAGQQDAKERRQHPNMDAYIRH